MEKKTKKTARPKSLKIVKSKNGGLGFRLIVRAK